MILPPLENLRIFEVVARLGGFTAAAENLSLSHSAVSRRVSELEQRLGVQLLQRTSRRVALTAEGKVLLEAAQDALKRIHEATKEITGTAQRAPLLVSCERSLAMRWLIPRLSSFQEVHADMPVYLSTGGGPIDLARANIDIAIRRADFLLDPHLPSIDLFPEYVGPVLAARASSNKALQTRLHTTGRPDAWKTWLRLRKAGKNGLDESMGNAAPPKNQYFDHFFLSLQAAEAGLGTAMAPLFMVADSLADGRLVAPSGFVKDGSKYIALLAKPLEKDSPQAHFVHWLLEIANATLKETAKQRLD